MMSEYLCEEAVCPGRPEAIKRGTGQGADPGGRAVEVTGPSVLRVLGDDLVGETKPAQGEQCFVVDELLELWSLLRSHHHGLEELLLPDGLPEDAVSDQGSRESMVCVEWITDGCDKVLMRSPELEHIVSVLLPAVLLDL